MAIMHPEKSRRQTPRRVVPRLARTRQTARSRRSFFSNRTETMMATLVAPSKNTSEERLIRAGQRGEPQALNTLFHRHHRSLFRSALGVMGNPEDAEDALQDGLLSAFRNLKSFEGRSQFSTWLTRIVVNAALMRRRRQAGRPIMAVPSKNEIPITDRLVSKGPTPEELVGRLEIHQMIRGHIAELPPMLHTVFVLRILREYKTIEVARILRVSANTVKARLWRARHQLATRISRTLLKDVTWPQINYPRLSPASASSD
jgi:RNA polymerase sigma-70 factor (ECF subfamily)